MKHLSERRLRSKHRIATCQDLFLQSNPPRVAAHELLELENRDAATHKAFRRAGHSNIIAGQPCVHHSPSVLTAPVRGKRAAVAVASSHTPRRTRQRT